MKICGITRLEDARAVVAAGADALGLMFVRSSPRVVSIARARELAQAVGTDIARVGVFADPTAAEVERVLAEVELDILQFHGDEPQSFCERWNLPYIKAARVRSAVDGAGLRAAHPGACAWLLDAYQPGQLGGTGERFDLNYWPSDAPVKLVLAGGLDPTNVAAAIVSARPFAVDVSSGVEGAHKGEKCAAKIAEFVTAVREAG